MNHYLIILRPCRDTFLEDSTPKEDAVVAKHFEYLQTLLSKKMLVLAGRTDDATMGLVIIKTEDESRAEQIMNNDPAVKEGVFSAELKPYRLALFGEK